MSQITQSTNIQLLFIVKHRMCYCQPLSVCQSCKSSFELVA